MLFNPFSTADRFVARRSLDSISVAAQYLEKYPHWSPHDVLNAFQANALRGLVKDLPPSTSNLLLNTGDLRDPFGM
jgi:hypothetical protein